jgi:hypothetical protein
VTPILIYFRPPFLQLRDSHQPFSLLAMLAAFNKEFMTHLHEISIFFSFKSVLELPLVINH